MLQPALPMSQLPLPHEQYLAQHGDFPQMSSPLGGGLHSYVHHAHDGSPYYQPAGAVGGLERGFEGEAESLALARGYSSPGAYASPRHYASPRDQPYSPGARHAATPQPQAQYPASPAAFSAPSPPRAGYGSPGVNVNVNVGASRGFAARSPLYASSPAAYRQQPAHEPLPLGGFARSPAPAGAVGGVNAVGGGVGGASTPFPAASPAGAALHSYTPSPAHTPYSHHSSPAPAPLTPAYTDSHHFGTQVRHLIFLLHVFAKTVYYIHRSPTMF